VTVHPFHVYAQGLVPSRCRAGAGPGLVHPSITRTCERAEARPEAGAGAGPRCWYTLFACTRATVAPIGPRPKQVTEGCISTRPPPSMRRTRTLLSSLRGCDDLALRWSASAPAVRSALLTFWDENGNVLGWRAGIMAHRREWQPCAGRHEHCGRAGQKNIRRGEERGRERMIFGSRAMASGRGS